MASLHSSENVRFLTFRRIHFGFCFEKIQGYLFADIVVQLKNEWKLMEQSSKHVSRIATVLKRETDNNIMVTGLSRYLYKVMFKQYSTVASTHCVSLFFGLWLSLLSYQPEVPMISLRDTRACHRCFLLLG